jgi:tetratricopeptide (TPR) repeat protein
MSENDPALVALESTLQQAIDRGDPRAESVARVNIACAYLQLESPRALPTFEAALAAVRRAQNARSEGILSMAFAPYFVDLGDPSRALELAQRGEQIARRGRKGHRVLSLIQLARVLYRGFSDAEQAGKAVDAAVAALGDGKITESVDRQIVVDAAGQAALAAIEAGDKERALALTRIVDPAAAERLAQERPGQNAGLSPTQHEDLTRLYGQWLTRLSPGNAVDPRVAEMTRKMSEMLNWDEARARRGGASRNAQSICTFVERIYAVGAGIQSMASALAEASVSLTDDDLVFSLALATDAGFNRQLPGWVVFELVGQGAKDRALAGRCFRLAAAIGGQARDPRQVLSLLERADAALSGGVDDSLRADVANEIAVCQLNLRQAELALKAAERAVDLARTCGNHSLERMARGNVANALLGLQRVAEALGIFETLARDQAASGEHQMAEITRQNIEACRSFLKRSAEQG